jgi:hypothetical protein
VLYLRNVKTTFGPAKLRFRLWTTSWVERVSDESAIVHMHGYDDGTQSIHVVSKFVLTKVAGGVLVRYEEISRNTKASINIATNKIKKTHRRILQLVAAQVARNKIAGSGLAPSSDLPPVTNAVESDDSGDEYEAAEFVRWQDLPLDKVRAEMQNPATGVKVSDRQKGLKIHHNVWVANEAVDFLCEHFSLTREGSVQLMCELQKRGFIEYVKTKRAMRFEDEHLLFRWRDPTRLPIVQDVPSVVPVAEIKTVSRALRPSSPMATLQTTISAPLQKPQSLRPLSLPAVPAAAVLSSSSSSSGAVAVASVAPRKPVFAQEEKEEKSGVSMKMIAGAFVVALLSYYFGGFAFLQTFLWGLTAALVWLVFKEVKKIRQELADVGKLVEKSMEISRQMQIVPSAVAPSAVVAFAPEIVEPETHSVLLINGQKPNGKEQKFESEYALGSFLFKSRTTPLDASVADYFRVSKKELIYCFNSKQRQKQGS